MEPRASEPEAFPPPSIRQAATGAQPGPRAGEPAARRYLIADVDPLDVTGVRTVVVGTGIFLLAFLVLLPFTDELREQGRTWWLWTCATGVGLGIFGISYCRRRAAALARRAAQQSAERRSEV